MIEDTIKKYYVYYGKDNYNIMEIFSEYTLDGFNRIALHWYAMDKGEKRFLHYMESVKLFDTEEEAKDFIKMFKKRKDIK